MTFTAYKASCFSNPVSDIGQGRAVFADERALEKGAHIPLDVRGDRPIDQCIMFLLRPVPLSTFTGFGLGLFASRLFLAPFPFCRTIRKEPQDRRNARHIALSEEASCTLKRDVRIPADQARPAQDQRQQQPEQKHQQGEDEQGGQQELHPLHPHRREFAVGFHPVPSGEDEAAGAVFAVLADFLFLEDAEGFRGVVGALYVGGVQDVAQLVAGQAVGAGVESVELGAEERAAVLVPREGRAVMAQIAGEGGKAVRGVSEFQYLELVAR